MKVLQVSMYILLMGLTVVGGRGFAAESCGGGRVIAIVDFTEHDPSTGGAKPLTREYGVELSWDALDKELKKKLKKVDERYYVVLKSSELAPDAIYRPLSLLSGALANQMPVKISVSGGETCNAVSPYRMHVTYCRNIAFC